MTNRTRRLVPFTFAGKTVIRMIVLTLFVIGMCFFLPSGRAQNISFPDALKRVRGVTVTLIADIGTMPNMPIIVDFRFNNQLNPDLIEQLTSIKNPQPIPKGLEPDCRLQIQFKAPWALEFYPSYPYNSKTGQIWERKNSKNGWIIPEDLRAKIRAGLDESQKIADIERQRRQQQQK